MTSPPPDRTDAGPTPSALVADAQGGTAPAEAAPGAGARGEAVPAEVVPDEVTAARIPDGGAGVPAGGGRLRVILAVIVAVLALLTVVALKVLWPPPVHSALENTTSTVDYLDATVTKVELRPCGLGDCEAVEVRLDTGPEAGAVKALTSLAPTASTPVLQVGDLVVVARELQLTADDFTYSFAGLQRRAPMVLLGLLFAGIVVLVARWRGLAALVGLLLTWFVLVQFLVPALLAGESPIAVGLTASTLIMFIVLYLAHGVSVRTTIALFGTLASLAVTGALAWFFVGAAHLTGITSDAAAFVATTDTKVDLSGLLLCGMIIGSLGVLNDVTVTQAAAVWEIRAADPSRHSLGLYHAGMRIGRDHIASTVYTLVLAYAGASLPLVILFIMGHQPFGDIVTGEIVAEEIVRTLVGSIGLVASVPLTTLMAALIVTREPVRAGVADGTPGGERRVFSGLSGLSGPLGRSGRGLGARLTALPEAARRGRDERRRRRTAAKAQKHDGWQPPPAEREFWDS